MFISAPSGGAALLAVSKLQKTSTGEYTAGSVAIDPNDAISKFLTRLQDGNYAALNSPLSRSSDAVRSALYGFSLGG